MSKWFGSSRMDSSDGAFKSRKFILSLIGLGLLTGVTLSGVWSSNVATMLPTFTGGLLGVISLYFTGNVMNKHVIGSTAAKLQKKDKGDE
jgi:hypothetical protein